MLGLTTLLIEYWPSLLLTLLYLCLATYSGYISYVSAVSILEKGVSGEVKRHLIAHTFWSGMISLISCSHVLLMVITSMNYGKVSPMTNGFFLSFNTTLLGFLFIAAKHFKEEGSCDEKHWLGL